MRAWRNISVLLCGLALAMGGCAANEAGQQILESGAIKPQPAPNSDAQPGVSDGNSGSASFGNAGMPGATAATPAPSGGTGQNADPNTHPAVNPNGAANPPTWQGTWATAAVAAPVTFADTTLRQVVHTSIGGSGMRIHVSNVLGNSPLVVDSIRAALRTSGSGTDPASAVPLSFGGADSVTVAPGTTALTPSPA